MPSKFLIAAPYSGSGKTTVTLGLIRVLRKRGLAIQSFKCGPDYLDPKLHEIASGKSSINVDRYTMGDEHISYLFHKNGSEADVIIAEGVMGLFDGAAKAEGSSADIAKTFNLPVILVINAKAMAYSAAAILSGFKLFDPMVNVAGVIFNFVATGSHYNILKAAAEDVGLVSLGYLPPNDEINIPSRHLGLNTGAEVDHEKIIEKAGEHISKHLNLDKLLQLTNYQIQPHQIKNADAKVRGNRKIAIARDAAFNFLYQENINALSKIGTITYFSPLEDKGLPEADLIYLPGGYPELHLNQLANNTTLKKQLYEYYKNGGKILAECGGMMYLGEAIIDENGISYPMAGILDIVTGMQQKKLSLGYRRIDFDGIVLKGHEFHYSQFVNLPAIDNDIKVSNARGELIGTPVFRKQNLLASYMHFYFGDNIETIEKLLF